MAARPCTTALFAARVQSFLEGIWRLHFGEERTHRDCRGTTDSVTPSRCAAKVSLWPRSERNRTFAGTFHSARCATGMVPQFDVRLRGEIGLSADTM